MSGTLLAVYPDVVAAGIDALRAALTDRTEPYVQGVTFDVQQPPTGALLPVVQVANDGGETIHPVVTRPLLRVSVWHVGESYAHDLAQLCQGLLLAHSGDEIAACYPVGSPVGDTDPSTEQAFSTFTVRAVLRARTL